MAGAEYIINPVLMGGLVKEVTGDRVKVHLHGRLGVITVPAECILREHRKTPERKSLRPEQRCSFTSAIFR